MSIDERVTSNEWHVQGYLPVGIFILEPILVRRLVDIGGEPTAIERPIELAEAIACFPGMRIFSANEQTFLEWDRANGAWKVIAYDDMFAA